jgi:hypothetical protein
MDKHWRKHTLSYTDMTGKTELEYRCRIISDDPVMTGVGALPSFLKWPKVVWLERHGLQSVNYS